MHKFGEKKYQVVYYINFWLQRRGDKIRRFQEEKEREKRLNELLEAVEKDNADDEVVREYYMTLLKSNISQSMEEISSLQQEKNILQHMERLKQDPENSEVN